MTSPRAVLHVGLPKTGTSFLQGVLRGNTEVLAKHGVRLPTGAEKPLSPQLFAAVLYLTERSDTWGRSADEGRRAWERMAADVRRHDGTTVVSSETLCLATDEQIGRILADLPGVEVDVVVTVRDPARQVPAEYQEGVKHGRRMSFPTFLETVLDGDEDASGGGQRGSTRRRFWNAQDPVAVLDRWAAHVRPDRCHVVTCPPAGAEPTLLWDRMARVLGVEDVAVQMPPQEVNTSLGAVQIEVLRRLNRRVNRRGNERTYGDVVKRLYAGTILRGQSGERLRLPAEHAERVRELATGWVEQLADRGYRVSGELADLVPQPSGDDTHVRKGAARMLASSLDATADLLREVERLREENARLRGDSEGSRLRRRNPVEAGSGGGL